MDTPRWLLAGMLGIIPLAWFVAHALHRARKEELDDTTPRPKAPPPAQAQHDNLGKGGDQ